MEPFYVYIAVCMFTFYGATEAVVVAVVPPTPSPPPHPSPTSLPSLKSEIHPQPETERLSLLHFVRSLFTLSQKRLSLLILPASSLLHALYVGSDRKQSLFLFYSFIAFLLSNRLSVRL